MGVFTNSLRPCGPVLFSGASLSRCFWFPVMLGLLLSVYMVFLRNFLGKQNYCGYPCCFENTLIYNIVPSVEMLHTVIVSLNR